MFLKQYHSLKRGFKAIIFILSILISNVMYAQLNPNFIGDAISLGNDCYRITNNVNNQLGGVWYDNPIDFSEDFEIIFDLNLGSNDANGADGICLVFKTTSTPELGTGGGGIGYDGISNSLAIEFDTWQNFENNDPFQDHVSLISNGNLNHIGPNSLVPPVNISATSANVEDGNFYEVKVQWTAATQTLVVIYDCDQRITYTGDLVNTIFGGNVNNFFGFVGSTGGANNIQQVCFKSISFVDDLILEDQEICNGESITSIDVTYDGASGYSWSPTTGLNNPNIPNPIFSPSTTTTYTVAITDSCNELIEASFTIDVLPSDLPTFDPIPAICEGDTLMPLPTTSNNGITGTWSPALDNTTTTIYTFTPDGTQCSSDVTLEIVVNPNITPTFDPIPAICEGETLAPLPTTSNNGITGTWNPAIDNTTTTIYTFTPNAGQGCVLETTTEIIVTPRITPTFNSVDSICAGENLAALPTTSLNGITGSWSPAIDNTVTTLYTFTPDVGQCADIISLTIEVDSTDTDGDGIFDSCDLDDDNDGILDSIDSSYKGIEEWEVVALGTSLYINSVSDDSGTASSIWQNAVLDSGMLQIINADDFTGNEPNFAGTGLNILTSNTGTADIDLTTNQVSGPDNATGNAINYQIDAGGSMASFEITFDNPIRAVGFELVDYYDANDSDYTTSILLDDTNIATFTNPTAGNGISDSVVLTAGSNSTTQIIGHSIELFLAWCQM